MDDTSQPKEDTENVRESQNKESTPEPVMQPRVQSGQENNRDIVWPLFLIFIGSMFLLNTTGFVSWEIWSVLWRFWPVFLILGGLQLMLGQNKVSSWLVGIVAIVLFGVLGLTALALVDAPILERLNITVPETWQDVVQNVGEEKTMQRSIKTEDYGEVDEFNLEVNLGVGSLHLDDDGDEDEVVGLDAIYYENWGEPKLDAELDDSKLKVSFSQKRDSVTFGFHDSAPKYNLSIGEIDYPGSIDIDIGAGSGTFDLKSISTKSVSADVGAGKLEMSFSKKSTPSSMDLNVGAGALEINLSEDVGYSIDYSIGVGQIDARGNTVGGVGSNGTDLRSGNYDVAEKVVIIKADVGTGKIVIR